MIGFLIDKGKSVQSRLCAAGPKANGQQSGMISMSRRMRRNEKSVSRAKARLRNLPMKCRMHDHKTYL